MGSWKAGRKAGKGTLRRDDCIVYKGAFKDDKRHGLGREEVNQDSGPLSLSLSLSLCALN